VRFYVPFAARRRGRPERRGTKLFQGLPNFSKEIPRKFLGFPNFSKDFQIFSLAVSRKIKRLWAGRAGIAFSPIFASSRPRRAARPAPPNAPAIQYIANSDYRKDIVATEIVGGAFPKAASERGWRRRRRKARDKGRIVSAATIGDALLCLTPH
jgi:hypothetical protein